MPIKLVALDIDGTLLDSEGNLPSENGQAIQEAVQKGVKVILVSGRRWRTACQVSAALGLTFPVVAHNGALIRSPIDSRALARFFLKPGFAAEILSLSQGHLGYLVLHRDQDFQGQTVVHPECRQNARMQNYLGQFPEAVLETESLLPWADEHLIQMMYGGELPRIREIEAVLRSKTLAAKVKLTKTYYPHKNLGIVDVLDRDVSKRVALEFLARYYGVSHDEILAIGDNYNDLEMLV
ncbi:MAG: HAD-IIB family hydrolase [Acidimicrobiia bacterium]|nr:HAD-IIB family hydrolase [Acidimicrobiia bacterium]